MSEIQAIIETAIYVDDLDRTEQFYRDVLGLAVIAKEPGRHVFFRVGANCVLLAFIPEATLRGDRAACPRKQRPGPFRARHRRWSIARVEAAALGGRRCHRAGSKLAEGGEVALLS